MVLNFVCVFWKLKLFLFHLASFLFAWFLARTHLIFNAFEFLSNTSCRWSYHGIRELTNPRLLSRAVDWVDVAVLFAPNLTYELLAHSSGYINGEEFVLLWDAYNSRKPEFPSWNYERFDLDEVSDVKCKAKFRFFRSDIYVLADALRLPDEIMTYNGLVVASIPALCILAKRFAYPCRFGTWFHVSQDRFRSFVL